MNEALDFSFARARAILPFQAKKITLFLVGAGGTGSYLARHVARLAWLLQTQANKKVCVVFIDHDLVEAPNVLRQDFCEAEIGLPKARVLALRYSAAFGIEIHSVIERFHPDMVTHYRNDWSALSIVCGCVDNAAARQAIAQVFDGRTQDVPMTWWVDSGNSLDAGQVLCGTTNVRDYLADAFILPGYCSKLPSPIMQHPELLIARPEELEGHRLSCEDLLLANAQSLMVNQQVAAYAAEMLYEMLITQKLRRLATYFHQPSGTAKSLYITPETIARVIGVEADFWLTAEQAQQAKAQSRASLQDRRLAAGEGFDDEDFEGDLEEDGLEDAGV